MNPGYHITNSSQTEGLVNAFYTFFKYREINYPKCSELGVNIDNLHRNS